MEDRQRQAHELAQRHYQVETGITKIHHITDAADAASGGAGAIKLLEVNKNTVATGIFPLWFGPSPALGIHYPSVIVEVTPEEYEEIKGHQLSLPNGWSLGPVIPRRRGAGSHG